MGFEFVAEDCKNYDIKIASGHSKGGNLTQCVTVMLPERVDKCVSFDAQGFSKYFHKRHSLAIEARKNDITNISSYKDFVNPLLDQVAEEENIKYIKTAPDIKGKNNHKAGTLYNDAYFDVNGNFIKDVQTERSPMMNALHNFIDGLQVLPKFAKMGIAEVFAPIVGVI